MKRMFIFFAAFLMMFCYCRQASRVRILKLAHALDTNHPVHKGMVYMAQQVQKNSDGRMRVDIYPSGQLGSERELVELLQIGSLAMTKVSAAALEAFIPEMQIFGVPYLFSDEEHAWKIFNGEIGKRLLLSGERYFLRGLCYYDAGSRSFYTTGKPVQNPQDLSGMKIRVMQSITSVEMIKALGGSSTPIPWGELYTALQQGVVDGAENNPPSFHLSRHYEVCKYYSLDEHTTIPDMLMISTVVWKGLSDQERKWLQDAVDASVPVQRGYWKEAVDEALNVVQSAGVQVLHPEKDPFREKVISMYDSYKSTPIFNLIKEIELVGSISIYDIGFDPGQYQIKKEFYSELDRLVSVLNDNKSWQVEIIGHTDNIGSTENNQILSMKRANEVMNYLIKGNRILSNQIKLLSHGENRPIESNSTEEGRAKNRRVEFRLIYEK